MKHHGHHNPLNGLPHPRRFLFSNPQELLNRVRRLNMEQNGDSSPVFLLPMAVAEGSPVHPAYPSGHAVNLGAYITALKVRGAHLCLYPTL